jgi:hypothetical protein
MAGISTGLSVALLDWHLGGKAATQPSSRAVGISTTTPTSVSAFELVTGVGGNRQAVTYNSAVAAGMSAINSNTVSFGPMTNPYTIVGLQVWNTVSSGAASELMMWYGTLATARTLLANDSLTFNPGAIVHTLS